MVKTEADIQNMMQKLMDSSSKDDTTWADDLSQKNFTYWGTGVDLIRNSRVSSDLLDDVYGTLSSDEKNNQQYAFRGLARKIVANQLGEQLGLPSNDYSLLNKDDKGIVVELVALAMENAGNKIGSAQYKMQDVMTEVLALLETIDNDSIGPDVITEINQANEGNCWFLAGLGALANCKGRKTINR
jgi:hypothetical protein